MYLTTNKNYRTKLILYKNYESILKSMYCFDDSVNQINIKIINICSCLESAGQKFEKPVIYFLFVYMENCFRQSPF